MDNKDELHRMHDFVCDFWQFMKTHFKADPKDDAFWEDTVFAIKELTEKYNQHPAVIQTLMGYLNYLDCEGSGKERKR